MGVKRPPLAWCQVDLPNLDPVVLKPQPCAYLEIARGDGKLVLELRRIEGSLVGDLSQHLDISLGPSAGIGASAEGGGY